MNLGNVKSRDGCLFSLQYHKIQGKRRGRDIYESEPGTVGPHLKFYSEPNKIMWLRSPKHQSHRRAS
jgi:hypothetical protein